MKIINIYIYICFNSKKRVIVLTYIITDVNIYYTTILIKAVWYKDKIKQMSQSSRNAFSWK